MAEGLEVDEHKALAANPWQPGGPEPFELASHLNPSSPYSKAHDDGVFILDVATIPVPLARHALRVFDDDDKHLLPLIRHSGFSAETLSAIWDHANAPRMNPDPESWRGSILLALATNPNLPKDLLRKLWRENPTPASNACILPFLVSRHPAADAEWYPEILRRIATEGEVSVLLRNSLASHYPLPGEVVDLLIRHADPKAYHTPGPIFRSPQTFRTLGKPR